MRLFFGKREVAAPAQPRRNGAMLRGYLYTLGGLAAVATGLALFGIIGIVLSVFFALFIAVGLDPTVRLLQRRGLRRGTALATVILFIVAVFVVVVWVGIPILIDQIGDLVVAVPQQVDDLKSQGWFDPANETSNGILSTFFGWLAEQLSDPEVWAEIAGGAVGLGLTVASAISSAFFIFILVIYFMATYDAMKNAAYRLVAASHREQVIRYSERILQNVGRGLNGMVILATINSIFSFLLLFFVGVPAAFLLGVSAFFFSLIPLIGTVLSTCVMTVVAFLYDPLAAVIVLLAMLIYMQIESYIFTPKVMSKAVAVPGVVVFISATAGGALFGLAGALVAIPVSAGIILILREVVMPRKARQ